MGTVDSAKYPSEDCREVPWGGKGRRGLARKIEKRMYPSWPYDVDGFWI